MKRDLLARVLLAATLIAPGLALGAVHPEVLGATLIAAAGLFAILALEGRGIGRVRLDLPGAVLLVLIGFTALQLVPLPAGLVEIVSPAAHEVRERALGPLGMAGPSFVPLTLDTSLTAAELGKLVLYLAVYWAALAVARRRGSDSILKFVVAAGVAGAFVLLAHRIMLPDRLYGIYAPLHKGLQGEWISAPLVNPNHAAALLGFGAALAIGHALSAQERSSRILSIGVASLIGGAVLLTLSRGGIAAFVAGQLVFVTLRLVHRFRGSAEADGDRQHAAWLPLGLALSTALGLFAVQDALFSEFAGGDVSKLQLLGEALPLVAMFPAVGVGRGAFWVGFPLVSDRASAVTFTHVENAPVQLLADWGVAFGGLALVTAAVVVARHLLRPPERTRHAAALAALVAFGIHNLVDFNLEIPGVAVLAVALLAVLQSRGRERSDGAKDAPRRRTVPRAVHAGFGLAALGLAIASGLHLGAHSVDADERRLAAALESGDAAAFAPERIEPLLRRHPASWYIPFLCGVRTFHARDGNPLPWLARALEVNPSSAAAHYYAARAFLGGGHLDQALLEFRLAGRRQSALAAHAARDLVRVEPGFEALSRIAVTGRDKILFWGALSQAFAASGLDSEAEKADLAILEVDGGDPKSLARHARRLAARGEFDGALELARRLGDRPDLAPAAAVIEAGIHRSRGDREREVAVLEKALGASPNDRHLLGELAWARQRSGDHEGAMEAARRLKSTSRDAASLSAAAVLEGRLEEAEGRVSAALARYRHAHALDPSKTHLLVKIADLAERHGDRVHAVEALRRLVGENPGDRRLRERLRALQRKLEGAAEKSPLGVGANTSVNGEEEPGNP